MTAPPAPERRPSAEVGGERRKQTWVWLLEFEGDIPSDDGTWWVCHACEGHQKHRLRRVKIDAHQPTDEDHKKRNFEGKIVA